MPENDKILGSDYTTMLAYKAGVLDIIVLELSEELSKHDDGAAKRINTKMGIALNTQSMHIDQSRR